MLKISFNRLLILGFALFLNACSMVAEKQDSAPKSAPDVAGIPNAVPKHEPRSKYGNPPHYEVFGKRYYTLSSSQGYVERGIASWYGSKFHGRRTSSGEIYDMYAMTAAHKTLPLPTYVEVTNLENGRSVVLKVNDRGPFHGNRLIDLSYSAATKLGIVAKGTGLVEVRAITPGTMTAAPVATTYTTPVSEINDGPVSLYLQVGAFSTPSRAEQLKTKLQREIGDAVMVVPFTRPQGELYRVRIGPIASVEYGDSLVGQLLNMGFPDAHIVVE